MIIAVIILPLLALGLVNFDTGKFDLALAFIVLSTGFLVGSWFLTKSVKHTILPYMILQMVFLLIYLNDQIQTVAGISLRLYAISFAIAALAAFYYIIFHFKYLWNNFIAFRLIFIFFIINILYIVFNHYSDFRSQYISLMDVIIHSTKFQKVSAITGVNQIRIPFGESKIFGVYLEGICPLIALTVALTLFKNVNNRADIISILEKIRNYFVYGFIAYYIIIFFSLILGISEIKIHNNRLWLDMMGMGAGGVELYLAMFTLVFVGFKYFLKTPKIIDISINLIILLNVLIIVLSLRKTCLVSLTVSSLVFFILNFKYDKEGMNRFIRSLTSKYALIIGLAALVIFIGFNERLIFDYGVKFTSKFTNPETMFQRGIIWHQFTLNWFENLNIYNILFGFGVDSSRELVYYITSMDPLGTGATIIPHWEPHNFYLRNFYEYGLVALIYFGAIFSILVNNAKKILSKNTDRILRTLSSMGLILAIFYFIYITSDIIRIPIAIIFFSFLGMLESAKYAYEKSNEHNYN